MSGPKIPSQAKIKRDAQLEEERVRFENEKRLFIERVGSYETIASERQGASRGTFEYAPTVPVEAGSLQIPQRFDPTFDPSRYENFADADLSWFSAPNLGLNYEQVRSGNALNNTILPMVSIPSNRPRGSRPGFGRSNP